MPLCLVILQLCTWNPGWGRNTWESWLQGQVTQCSCRAFLPSLSLALWLLLKDGFSMMKHSLCVSPEREFLDLECALCAGGAVVGTETWSRMSRRASVVTQSEVYTAGGRDAMVKSWGGSHSQEGPAHRLEESSKWVLWDSAELALVRKQNNTFELCCGWITNTTTQISQCHWIQQWHDWQIASAVKNPEFWTYPGLVECQL